MRISQESQTQSIYESSNPIEVVRLSDDRATVTFKAYIEVDVREALATREILYSFEVYSDQPIDTSRAAVSAQNSSSALDDGARGRDVAAYREASIISEGIIDISSQIPNDRIGQILAGGAARTVSTVRLTRGTVSIPNSESSATKSAVPDYAVRPILLDLLHRKSLDPTFTLNSINFHSTVADATQGLRTVGDTSKSTDELDSIRAAFTKSSNFSISTILETAELSTLSVPFTFEVSVSQVYESNGTISVRVFSNKQEVSFRLHLRQPYEKFLVPTTPPILQAGTAKSSLARKIRVKQMDENSSSVLITRKIVGGSESEGYVAISTPFDLRFGEEIEIEDRISSIKKVIYRAVPFSPSVASSGVFSSVIVPEVLGKRESTQPDKLTILANEVRDGVKITVFNAPPEVKRVRLVRKNLTTFERDYGEISTITGGSLKNVESSATEFLDLPGRIGAKYEYKAVLLDSYGGEELSRASSVVNYVGNSTAQGKASLNVSLISVSPNGFPEVSFQIDFSSDPSSLDFLYTLLENSNLSSLYSNEISQNRQLLSSIAALEILRFDSFTGLNESFGIISPGVFQDNYQTRIANNVSSLVAGRRYVYQYRLLLRDPSTLFSQSTVSQVDLETGKAYDIKLKKFRSPKVLKLGTLSPSAEQIGGTSNVNSSADEMFQGITSLTGEVSVVIPSIATSITDQYVERSSRGNVLNWSLQLGSTYVDSIIVHADYNGKLAPLQVLTALDGRMAYVDNKTSASLKEIKYYLQIIFSDYSLGNLIGPLEER